MPPSVTTKGGTLSLVIGEALQEAADSPTAIAASAASSQP